MFWSILGNSRFAGPMSRQQITERRELPLRSLRPDRHRERIFDCSLLTRKGVHNAAAQAGQTDKAGAELVTTNGLFASLVFQKIRPRSRSVGDATAQRCSVSEPQPGRAALSVPDIQCPLVPQEVSTDSIRVSIETLFGELARRRLGSLAARERE